MVSSLGAVLLHADPKWWSAVVLKEKILFWRDRSASGCPCKKVRDFRTGQNESTEGDANCMHRARFRWISLARLQQIERELEGDFVLWSRWTSGEALLPSQSGPNSVLIAEMLNDETFYYRGEIFQALLVCQPSQSSRSTCLPCRPQHSGAFGQSTQEVILHQAPAFSPNLRFLQTTG